MEFFAGFEAHGFAGGDGDLGAGAGIAADAGLAGTYIEDPEAAKLDAIAGGERLLQALEDGVNGCLGLVSGQASLGNHMVEGGVAPGAGADAACGAGLCRKREDSEKAFDCGCGCGESDVERIGNWGCREAGQSAE